MNAQLKPMSRNPDVLSGMTVGAFATIGMVSCPPDASLDEVAALMSMHLVHAIVVEGSDGDGRQVISDADLVSAAASGEFDHLLAADITGTEVVYAASGESLRRAAQLLAEHAVTHLVVRDPGGPEIGVLSTMDIARAIAMRT